MHSKISNRIVVYAASNELREYCQEELMVTNPKYRTLMRLGKRDQVERMRIPKDMALYTVAGFDLVLPFGCLRDVWRFIGKSKYEIAFNKCQDIPCKNDTATDKPFDYQEVAIEKMLEAKGGILIGGCGSGKTNCGIEIIRRIGKNALWLCHTKDLLVQTVSRIKHLYPNMPVGTITEGKIAMVSNGITVSTIQTMVTIEKELYQNMFEVVVCDECHRVSGSPTLMKSFVKVIDRIPARYKYGLTASDSRNDTLTKTMYAFIGCNLDGKYKPVWKIARKDSNTLTATHVKFELDTPLSRAMLETDGTFSYPKLVKCIAENEERNNTICKNIVKCAKEGRKQLVLCNFVGQCKTIHKKLLDLGINSRLVIGSSTDKQRKETLTCEVDWDVIVATVSLAKEGLDVVTLDTLHLASSIANKSDTVQSVGRIERVCEGKQAPIVYDYVDVKIPYLVNRYKEREGWLKRRK